LTRPSQSHRSHTTPNRQSAVASQSCLEELLVKMAFLFLLLTIYNKLSYSVRSMRQRPARNLFKSTKIRCALSCAPCCLAIELHPVPGFAILLRIEACLCPD